MPSSAKASVISFKAGGTVTENYVVKLDSTEDQVVVAAADNDDCIGFAEASQSSGEHIAVHTSSGETRYAVASGAVSLGDELIAAAGGKVKTDPATSSSTSNIVAIALEDAADGETFRVMTRFYRRYNA